MFFKNHPLAFISLILLTSIIGCGNTNNGQKDNLSSIPTSKVKEISQANNTHLQKNEKNNSKTFYPVISVSDGDTITVNIDGKKEKIRMIGLDTPETVDPRKPVQCFGKEASNKGKELLENSKVALEADPTQGDRDKYTRLLRYVYLEDGTLYNKHMINEGFAHEYTYNTPYKYQDDFKNAEKEAKENKKGLWGNKCNGDTTQPALEENKQVVETKKTNVNSTTLEAPIQSNTNYKCDCKKTCSQITSCVEAKYQLENCGCSQRDGDKDGIACDNMCQ